MLRIILALLVLIPVHALAASEHTYCQNGGVAQKLDIYPQRKAGPGKGLIVYIHGGGYVEGDKRSAFELRRARLLTAWGFSVASINYRLKVPFPAPVEDALCAIRWLKTNGEGLGIDTDFIGLVGDSAGGHLAALLGTLSGVDDNPKIDAVAAFYALLDTENLEPESKIAKAGYGRPGFPFPTQSAIRTWNPFQYISRDDPSFLLVHGKEDSFVSVAQSVRFAVKLKQVGQKPLVLAVENAEHGLVSRGAINPTAKAIDQTLVRWVLAAQSAASK